MDTTETVPGDDSGRCQTLAGFEDDRANGRWLVVNDDVMGGGSDGGLSFVDGVLVFEGDINTDGGGFSSLRLPLDADALADHDRIELLARSDGRSYLVTLDDDVASRDRRVSHRAPLRFNETGEWETVSVAFDDLFPAIFGRPIDDLPFRKDLVTRLGLMISEGQPVPHRVRSNRSLPRSNGLRARRYDLVGGPPQPIGPSGPQVRLMLRS